MYSVKEYNKRSQVTTLSIQRTPGGAFESASDPSLHLEDPSRPKSQSGPSLHPEGLQGIGDPSFSIWRILGRYVRVLVTPPSIWSIMAGLGDHSDTVGPGWGTHNGGSGNLEKSEEAVTI